MMRVQQTLLRALGHYWDLFVLFFLVLVAFYFGSNLFSVLRFDKEKIEIWAHEGQIQVQGLYHYQNRSPLPLSFSLGLPFPVDSQHESPSTFSVSEIESSGAVIRDIDTRNYHGGTVFRVWFAPRQEKWIRVEYVQGARTSGGRYILLTTRNWKRPLDSGVYILHLAQGLELASSNYPLQFSAERIKKAQACGALP
jgi:hypothetical protein